MRKGVTHIMKIKTDIRRLCDGLPEEFFENLEVTWMAEQAIEPEAGLETEPKTELEMKPESETGAHNGDAGRPDLQRIKEITFRKIYGEDRGKEKEIKKPMKRISNKIIIAAALIAVLTTTAFAAGGFDFFRGFFGDSVDQAGDSILQIAATAQDKDFTMTAEQIISDGINTKIIVGLQPESKEARKWLGDPNVRIDIRAESKDYSEDSSGMTGSDRLPQFDTKDKAYFCVSYVSDHDYTGKPITVTLNAVMREKEIGDEGTAVSKPGLSLVVENPTSVKTKKVIEFALKDGQSGKTQPVSLVVNAISAVLTLQEPKGSTDTPALDVSLVMKDGAKENIFEADWVSEGATGGGGAVMSNSHADLPLASGNSFQRNLKTSQVVQTSSFSRIIDVDSVDYAIVGGERYDFQ